jgi:multicomponent Na+:H+ antiporter subunit C
MTLALIVAIGLAVGAGVWLLLSRDLFRIVVGIGVLGSAVNLVVFTGGRPGSLIPPVISEQAESLVAGFANPLPQALVLTAIVIGFALLCFALLLGASVSRGHNTADIARHQSSEPQEPGESPYKPVILDEEP